MKICELHACIWHCDWLSKKFNLRNWFYNPHRWNTTISHSSQPNFLVLKALLSWGSKLHGASTFRNLRDALLFWCEHTAYWCPIQRRIPPLLLSTQWTRSFGRLRRALSSQIIHPSNCPHISLAFWWASHWIATGIRSADTGKKAPKLVIWYRYTYPYLT